MSESPTRATATDEQSARVRGPRHWRKLLKNGDVQFFFAVDGQTARGSGPGYMVDGLQEMFESSVGARLPPPTWRPPTAGSVDRARAERTRGATQVGTVAEHPRSRGTEEER